MAAAPKGRCSEGELKAQFTIFDMDGDGFITKSEMENIVKELELGTDFPQDLIDQMFDEADTNKDGKISFEGKIVVVTKVVLTRLYSLYCHYCCSLRFSEYILAMR